MIPILYESTVKNIPREREDATFNRINWGLGLIKDAKSAIVKEELGGEFTAEVVLPVSSQVYPELQVDRIIGIWCPYKKYNRTLEGDHSRNEGGRQPFRITSISKPMKGMVTVKCEHVSAQTKRIVIIPRLQGPVQYHYRYFSDLDRVGALPFTVDISEIRQDSQWIDDLMPNPRVPVSMRDYLQGKEGSITDMHGVDWIYNGWDITAVKKRGETANLKIMYGVNMRDLSQEEEIQNVRTAMYPYWVKEDNGVRTYVAPYAHDYVRCKYADNYAYDRIEIWDCTQDFETAPTVQQLKDWAADYMERNNWGVPNVSITVDLVTQAGSLGFNADAIKTPDITADQELYLGDSVEVIFERLGINTTARVVKYEFDSLRERYKKVEIGTIKPSITKSLAAAFKKTGVKIR